MSVLPPPTANRSKLRSVLSCPIAVGTKPLKSIVDCRTLKIVSPFFPQPGSPGHTTGICDGRKVEFQSGFIRSKS